MRRHIAGTPYRAVLTGASGGIGAAIARRLAPECALLILVARNSAALEALRREIGQHQVHLVCGDLTDAETRAAIAAMARDQGGINLLINNAGISDFHAFDTQSGDVIGKLLDVNLLAPMLLTHTLLPQLAQAPAAQVINIGSVFGAIGFPGFAAYCAAKGGLATFSQALRRELSDGTIEVRHFAPRATRTAINSTAVDAMNAELNAAQDMPEAVAAAFHDFLVGSASRHVIGLKERFLVLVNSLFPAIPDQAIRAQLPIIRKYLPK